MRAWIVSARSSSSCSSDVQQRAADVVRADLHRALPLIRHVAVGAGHPAAGVDPLRPGLELGVLCLEHGGPGVGVHPVAETQVLVVRLGLVHPHPVVPGVGEVLALAVEIILHVALGAGEGAHLLPVRHDVRVVRLPARALTPPLDAGEHGERLLALGQDPDPVQESGAGDPDLHGSRRVTVDAGDRMLGHLCDLVVGHRVGDLEALHLLLAELPFRHTGLPAQLPVDREHRGVAVQARAGLVELGHAERLALVAQHVRVPPLLPVVHPEGVAVEEGAEPGVLVQLVEGLAAAVAGAGGIDRAQVALVLAGVVLPPLGRVDGLLGDLHDLEGVPHRFGFPLRDVLGEEEHTDRGHRGDADGGGVHELLLVHDRPFLAQCSSTSVRAPPLSGTARR